MTKPQLKKCIALGEGVADGRFDLAALERKSLAGRAEKGGKKKKRKRTVDGSRVGGDGYGGGVRSKYFNVTGEGKYENIREGKQGDIRHATAAAKKRKLFLDDAEAFEKENSPRPPEVDRDDRQEASPPPPGDDPEAAATLIRTSSLSPFRQRVLLALLQVPRGRYTTYAAISAFLASSPRAVGNAMRNNPFAPTVPCHRVLAANGSIGGFGGEWGTEGKFAGEKVRLLRSEGVGFDGRGRVLGGVWSGFR
ncbi:methylated-DNA--protein-cysteine methyltransferase [Hypocenomyce scalaris]|nr:methylated-DNA--protein-cysteine methyltransferase [Hypocenomyce scalaris]